MLLIEWPSAPVEVPTTIPVRLVLEQPPPPPPAPAPPEPAAKPPPGRLASEEVGAKADEPDAVAPQSAAPEEPEPRRQVESEPKPELRQAASLLPPEQQPTLLDREALALPEPAVEPLPEVPAAPIASRQRRHRDPGHRSARPRWSGPPAIRDEYLALLVTLVRPYLYLLPPELINGRRGTTSLAIRVLGDGTIARIAVSQSSGYPDIDARVIKMVAAVGRFPPLPSWIDQPSWDINFHLRFPFPQGGSERQAVAEAYGSRAGVDRRASRIASRISLGWLSIAPHSRRIWRRRL